MGEGDPLRLDAQDNRGNRPDVHNGRGERLKVVCDHYLDLGLGLREAADEIVIWPCPSCGGPSFVARFEEGVAGCTEEDCEVPYSMDLPELVAYLDEELDPTDRKARNQRFSTIFEAAVGDQRQREAEHKERRRITREERRRQRHSEKDLEDTTEQRSYREEHLF